MAWGSKAGESGGVPVRGGGLSFIGAEIVVSGNISGNGDLHLDGAIEGDLSCNTLILGPGGRVQGNIQAATATLAGTVQGAVDARSLTVEKSARIAGDLTYENLSIENGAQVDGRLKQRGGDMGLKLVVGE